MLLCCIRISCNSGMSSRVRTRRLFLSADILLSCGNPLKPDRSLTPVSFRLIHSRVLVAVCATPSNSLISLPSKLTPRRLGNSAREGFKRLFHWTCRYSSALRLPSSAIEVSSLCPRFKSRSLGWLAMGCKLPTLCPSRSSHSNFLKALSGSISDTHWLPQSRSSFLSSVNLARGEISQNALSER